MRDHHPDAATSEPVDITAQMRTTAQLLAVTSARAERRAAKKKSRGTTDEVQRTKRLKRGKQARQSRKQNR